MYNIINLSNNPEYINDAAAYYSKNWGASKHIYENSMENSLNSTMPNWYLLLTDEEIVGSFGLIMNLSSLDMKNLVDSYLNDLMILNQEWLLENI